MHPERVCIFLEGAAVSAISEVDIEAWREDEKQTDFLEARRKADNHVGWCVEMLYEDGWKPMSVTLVDYTIAASHKNLCKYMYPYGEFRIYEVVK